MKEKKAPLISEKTKIKHATFPVGPLLERGLGAPIKRTSVKHKVFPGGKSVMFFRYFLP